MNRMSILFVALTSAGLVASAIAADAPATPTTPQEWAGKMLDPTQNAAAFKDPAAFQQWTNAIMNPATSMAMMQQGMDPNTTLRMLSGMMNPAAMQNYMQFTDPSVAMKWMAAGMDPRFATALISQGINPNGIEQAFLLRFPSVPATAVSYGAACAGGAGQLALAASTLPYLGTTFTALCSGASPTAVGLAIYGLTQQSVPLANVLPQGQPGCQLLTTLDLLQLLPAAVGSQFTIGLPIPNAPALVGAVLQQQIAQLQFGAGGVLQSVATSNGLQLSIGSF